MNPWDVLSGAGYALDTPRRLLYSGGDALARGLGYEGKPLEHFKDVLTGAGMDENSMLTSALGMAGDVATDPLTYAGGYLGKLGAQAAQRGLAARTLHRPALAEVATQQGALGALAGSADVASGASGLGGIDKFRRPLENTVSMSHLENVPLGELPPLGQVRSRATPAGRVTGRVTRAPEGVLTGDVRDLLDEGVQGGSGIQDLLANPAAAGLYDPATGIHGSTSAAEALGFGQASRRHERVHAIINEAAGGAGGIDELPALLRGPAKLLRAGASAPHQMEPSLARLGQYVSDPRRLYAGLGHAGDELAAQTLQNRSTLNKALGAANFLFEPGYNARYTQHFADAGMDPRVLGLYSSLPRAFVEAGATAGAGVGAASGRLAAYLGLPRKPEVNDEE